MNPLLPKVFRAVFTIFAVLAALSVLCIVVVILLDPQLPPRARFGPYDGEFLGQPASIALQPGAAPHAEPTLDLRAFGGNVAMTVDRPAGVVEVFKSYGLPVLLVYAVFLTVLFELLRRLFRNVGRGESFTPQSVRLVQIAGGALIVYALLSAIGESRLAYAMYGYLLEHTEIAVSGTAVQLPPAERPSWYGYESPLWSAEFLAGLLVLALAEVFRQGLALQRDSDLTV